MQLHYVLSDRRSVRAVDVNASDSIADLLKLIQAQSRADYSPRDGLKLYRAQRHGDTYAPWLQADESDHIALCGGDKAVQAAFFVEKARLQPSQRLGDLFDLQSVEHDAILVIAKVPDDAELADEAEEYRKTNVFRLILIVAAVVLFKSLPTIAQMALHWRDAASACHAGTTHCEKGLLGFLTAATLVMSVFTAIVIALTIKILLATFKQETPTLRLAKVHAFSLLTILIAMTASAEDTALGYCESSSSTEVVHYVTQFLLNQANVSLVFGGLMSEIGWRGSAAFILVFVAQSFTTGSSPLKSPFSP